MSGRSGRGGRTIRACLFWRGLWRRLRPVASLLSSGGGLHPLCMLEGFAVLLGAVAGAVEVFESKGGWGCEVASPLNMVCRTNGRIDEVLVTRPTAQVTRPPALTRSRMTGKFYGPKAVGPLGALAPPKHRRSDGSEVASCNLLCTPEYGVATQVQTTTQLTG